MKEDQCCYADDGYCEGELWECETCHTHYCQFHWHETSLGRNVECVVCERERRLRDEHGVEDE